jgi:hypothetical protein
MHRITSERAARTGELQPLVCPLSCRGLGGQRGAARLPWECGTPDSRVGMTRRAGRHGSLIAGRTIAR